MHMSPNVTYSVYSMHRRDEIRCASIYSLSASAIRTMTMEDWIQLMSMSQRHQASPWRNDIGCIHNSVDRSYYSIMSRIWKSVSEKRSRKKKKKKIAREHSLCSTCHRNREKEDRRILLTFLLMIALSMVNDEATKENFVFQW